MKSCLMLALASWLMVACASDEDSMKVVSTGGVTGDSGGAGGSGGATFGSGGEGGATVESETIMPCYVREYAGTLLTDVDDGNERWITRDQVLSIDPTPLDLDAVYWSTSEDGSGTVTHEVVTEDLPPIDGNVAALHVTAKDFTDWGLQFMLMLWYFQDESDNAVFGFCDGTAFAGIRFWGKSATEDTDVVVSFPVPKTLWGECEPDLCNDFHGKRVTMTPEWQEFEVPFANCSQDGWGMPTRFATESITAIMWEWNPAVSSGYDLYVDQIEFLLAE